MAKVVREATQHPWGGMTAASARCGALSMLMKKVFPLTASWPKWCELSRNIKSREMGWRVRRVFHRFGVGDQCRARETFQGASKALADKIKDLGILGDSQDASCSGCGEPPLGQPNSCGWRWSPAVPPRCRERRCGDGRLGPRWPIRLVPAHSAEAATLRPLEPHCRGGA